MKKFYIIDGNSYIYRAYYAIRNLKNREGFPTNAIYGFISMLLKIIEENPDRVVVVFDAAKKTFRNDIFPEYKANRPPMPDDLVVQIPFIKQSLNSFNIFQIEEQGFEADDIIATLTEKFKNKYNIIIVSSDKDLAQLIDDNVSMWDTLKDFKLSVDNFHEKYHVPKENIIDYFALVGDTSDNIPGVKGIGAKSATKLINEFGSIENIYKSINTVKPERVKKLLIENRDNAFLSKKLIKLKKDVPVKIDDNLFILNKPDNEQLKKLFEKFDFKSLLKKFNIQDNRESIDFSIITKFPDNEELAAIFYENQQGLFNKNIIAGFTSNGKDVFITTDINILKSVFSKKILGYNIKDSIKILKKYDISLSKNFDDLQLLAYIDNPEEKNTLERISYLYFNKIIPSIEDYKKKKNRKINFSMLSDKDKEKFIAERVCAIYNATKTIKSKLDVTLLNLYQTLEKPLIFILDRMEENGIYLNEMELKNIKKELDENIKSLTGQIYKVAGKEFNINSPKQLSEILFNELNLKVIKKTKTGASTDNEVLEQLSLIHPLPGLILEYREKIKLYSTYIEGLLKAIDKKTKRIHPTFHQAITATGRLSCTNPNIQNIPVRTEYGDKIRKAFEAEKGNVLVALDYSQIELRVMAHFSEDEELLKAFNNNIDVHTLTASKIYGVDVEKVDNRMRRDGKTVNFAIIYGISPFGLAKSLKVTREKAKKFIENYFNEYKGVKKFIDFLIAKVKNDGYVETLTGRRRYISSITSRNFQQREFAKRVAINTPIQGSAADIIKLAMLKIDKELCKYNAKMIMQIHDELIFEVPEQVAFEFSKFAANIMENIFPELKVKLKVDAGIGKNWFEAH